MKTRKVPKIRWDSSVVKSIRSYDRLGLILSFANYEHCDTWQGAFSEPQFLYLYRLVPNREGSTSRLYIVTLII